MKQIKFLREYALLVLFVLIMGGFFLLDLCFTSNPYSELENRKLKQKPAFSLESLLENRYTKDYEAYINDQFVGRDGWITLKSVFESALGKTENNGVVYGADGYIFNKLYRPGLAETRSNGTGFGGDGEDTAALPVLNQAQLDRNIGFLTTFLDSYDGHVTVAIAPNSYGVLEEKLPPFLPNLDQEAEIGAVYDAAAREKVTTLDLLGPLTREAENRQVCYRTDHHWTTEGAWVGYRAYCEGRGLPYATLEELAPCRREEPGFLGTYYNKSKNFGVQADTLVWYDIPVSDVTIDGERTVLQGDGSRVEVTGLYQREKLSTRDKYAAFLYGNNGLTVIKAENNKGHREGETSRVLVIKDSYGNCFAPFLTYSYDEVWVADLRNMTFRVSQVLAENSFDDVLILYNLDTFQEDRNFSRITY
ncbi:MAG: hypothetical protein HFF11_04295 [Angelakisella sp.]|jgi:hypothetical protein|nr:hypothetical protein [Angelakisella sp.]